MIISALHILYNFGKNRCLVGFQCKILSFPLQFKLYLKTTKFRMKNEGDGYYKNNV